MISYKQYITESLSTSYQYEFLRYEPHIGYIYYFNTPYERILVYFTENHLSDYAGYPNTYSLGFSVDMDMLDIAKYQIKNAIKGNKSSLTNTQDPFKVFATVIAIAYNEYRKVGMDNIFIDVDKDFADKRYNLYFKIIKRLQSRYTYDVITPFITNTGILIQL